MFLRNVGLSPRRSLARSQRWRTQISVIQMNGIDSHTASERSSPTTVVTRVRERNRAMLLSCANNEGDPNRVIFMTAFLRYVMKNPSFTVLSAEG
jgi:hypothetical protein